MKVCELFEGEVKQFPTLKQMIDPATGKKVTVDMAKAKPISLLSAFGGHKLQALNDANIHLLEKPNYWEELDEADGKYRPLTSFDIKRAEKELGEKIKIVDAKHIFGTNVKPRGPLHSYSVKPVDDLLIVLFNDGTRYLIDTTQAGTYARMWAKIN